MPTTGSRIPPLDQSALAKEAVEALDGWAVRGRLNNIFLTLARHPRLLAAWMPFGTHTFAGSTLAPRTRELAILRTAWRCRSAYEWAHHVRLARRAGVTGEEIERVMEGPDAEGWAAMDVAVLRCVDELEDLASVTDETWAALTVHLDEAQSMDLVYTFGAYRTTAAAMNSFGVELDPGYEAPTALASPAARTADL